MIRDQRIHTYSDKTLCAAAGMLRSGDEMSTDQPDGAEQGLTGGLASRVPVVARPLSAMVVGLYGDRRGRKAALPLSIGAMGAGTLVLALTPSAVYIGIAAPGHRWLGSAWSRRLGGRHLVVQQVVLVGRAPRTRAPEDVRRARSDRRPHLHRLRQARPVRERRRRLRPGCRCDQRRPRGNASVADARSSSIVSLQDPISEFTRGVPQSGRDGPWRRGEGGRLRAVGCRRGVRRRPR